MAKLIKKTLKNALSKNADDAIKGSRNIIELSSNNYKIKDATMPKSGSFSTRPSRKTLNDHTRNAQNPNFKTRNQVGPIDYEIIDAEVKESRKSIKDKFSEMKSAYKEKQRNKPIEISPKNYTVRDMPKSGNFTTNSKDYKIARNRARNEARNKNVNNDIINAEGPRPDLLRLEDRTTKLENAFNMIDADMPEGMTILDQLNKKHDLKTRTPNKYSKEEKIRKQKATEDALYGQVGSIPNEKSVTNKVAQPETSPSGGNTSIMEQVQDKVKGNNFVYNMAAMGVGGGLVLNMANAKGQQTNAQLYGQY